MASGMSANIFGMATVEDRAVSASDVDQLCVDTIRTLAIDGVQRANSGHPGMPMAMAPVAYLLYAHVLRHNPANPSWPDRDRFVLSAGHASMLLYAALHLSGYDVSLEDLRAFRQWGSITPGHPEYGLTPGVETTTGPLGQGFANGVGMAIAERFLRERYGAEVCDHRTFALCSDGDLMEGITSEAASLAGHLGLGRLVCIYDDNGITIDGDTGLSFGSEDVGARFESYGWHVSAVEDVNDLVSLQRAIDAAIDEHERPSLIRVGSVIAYGAPTKAGSPSSHGSPLGEEEVRATKSALGLDPDRTFHVPREVYAAFDARERGSRLEREWRERGGGAWHAELEQEMAIGDLPSFEPGQKLATRAAGGQVMQALAEFLPTMIGGSADLASSVGTRLKSHADFSRAQAGRNIHFGVREHAMAGIVNGLALHGGIVRPFGSTFLQFADYMRPAIRLSALMGLKVSWLFSHDSVGLGEDGPTHQPVEHLAALRAIPGLTVIRPSDANETAVAWRVIVEELDGPACLIMSRQGLPVLDRSTLGPAEGLAQGGYVLADGSDAVIVATGSEVQVALEAREHLAAEGLAARVVAMPSLELFAAQDSAYREAVLPAGVPSVSVEAGVSQGWRGWVDRSVSIERFGASAPGGEVMAKLGITAEAVAEAVRALL
jgi:transketolase